VLLALALPLALLVRCGMASDNAITHFGNVLEFSAFCDHVRLSVANAAVVGSPAYIAVVSGFAAPFPKHGQGVDLGFTRNWNCAEVEPPHGIVVIRMEFELRLPRHGERVLQWDAPEEVIVAVLFAINHDPIVAVSVLRHLDIKISARDCGVALVIEFAVHVGIIIQSRIVVGNAAILQDLAAP